MRAMKLEIKRLDVIEATAYIHSIEHLTFKELNK